MSSPFTFFRRNSHITMVGIVILSMMAFTLDAVFSQEGTHFVMLGLMMGGILFAFAGIGHGRWIHYGIAGAVFGALCGWILPGVISPAGATVTSSTLGAFDNKRLSELMLRRTIANVFMRRAFETAYGQRFDNSAPHFRFYAYSDDDVAMANNDMMFGELMRAEADQLKIVVTDAMVSDYINERTSEMLSKEQFAQIRTSLNFRGTQVSEKELFDSLRGEIKAEMAYLLLSPRFFSVPQAPEVYYEFFRRTKVTQRLNTVRLDVDAFLDEVPEPSEAEVASLFADYRLKFPGTDEPGSPGFRQEQKAKLAYLEVGYKSIEQATTPPTDEEVEAYYNEKKDLLYRKPADEPMEDSSAIPSDAAPKEGGTEPVTTPEGEKPAEEPKPEGEQKPEGEPKPEDAPRAEGEPKPAEEAKPEAEPESADTPKSDGESGPEDPKPEDPKAEDEPKTENDAPVSECLPFSVDEEKPADEEPPAADSPAEKPVAEPSADASPPEPASPAQPKTTEQDAQPVPSTGEPQTPATEAPDDSKPPIVIPNGDEPAKPDFEIPKVEYQPLDDDLKNEIRDRMMDEKVRNAITERMAEVMIDLRNVEKDRAKARKAIVDAQPNIDNDEIFEKMRDYSKTMLEGMKAVAQKHGCAFVETPLLTFRELNEGEKFPVGAATEPAANPFMQAGDPVAVQVFQMFPKKTLSDDTNLFVRHHSVRNAFDLDGGEVHFAWWIVEFTDSHVPKLDDPGIHEEVVLAWKRSKARELVQKRAAELKELVQAGLAKPEAEGDAMAASLQGQTLLGKPDSAELIIRQTQTFSWIEQSMTPQMNFMQQRPSLDRSKIYFADEAGGIIRYAGERFMKAVFEEIDNGAVGVVPNEDLTSYYLVQPVERSSDEDILRQQFLTEGKQSGFRSGVAASLLNAFVASPASFEWERSIWAKYQIDRETLSED